MLSAEMEILRGPLLFSFFLALFIVIWRRPKFTGLFPSTLHSWKIVTLRIATAIAMTYSMAALIHGDTIVLLIGFTFAILTLILTSISKEDRDFLRPIGWIALSLTLFGGLLWPKVT